MAALESNNQPLCNTCGRPIDKLSPLSVDQLRNMHGQPVWIKEMEEWAIVGVDTGGQYKDMPFAQGISFNYNIIKRNLTCYCKAFGGETSDKDC